jgi:DNA-binding NtrC family response regulator
MSTTTVSAQKNAKKILIIEDEGEMCLLLNILIDDKNLELEHVKTIRSAIEYLDNKKPAVVILDNKLPDGYGVDFISYIKLNHPDVPIIMMSGYGVSAKDIALENGANLFIEKPFTKNQIYSAIHSLLPQETL